MQAAPCHILDLIAKYPHQKAKKVGTYVKVYWPWSISLEIKPCELSSKYRDSR